MEKAGSRPTVTCEAGREFRMQENQERFMTLLSRPPARLTAEQTAWVFNCQTHDIPILVAARLLRPLGSPAPNGIKYFSTAEMLELAKDRSWLAKVTNTVSQHWQKKNARKRTRHGAGEQNLSALEPPAD